MKKRAFTLVEILITMSVLGLVMITTVVSALRMDKIKEQKLEAVTNSFNTSVSVALNEILYYEAKKGIKYLSSSELASYFAEYMDGEAIKVQAVEKTQDSDAADDSEESQNTDITQNDSNNEQNEQQAIDVESGNCGEFVGGTYRNFQYINSATICTKFPHGITAGFYVNKKCNKSFYVKEYKSEQLEERQISDACGYIVYETKDSTGTFGQDLFVIGLGNRRLK